MRRRQRSGSRPSATRDLHPLEELYVEKWRREGVSEAFIDWAVDYARSWRASTAEHLLGDRPLLKRLLEKILVRRSLEQADRWLDEVAVKKVGG